MRAKWAVAAGLAAALVGGCAPRQLATKERLPGSVLRNEATVLDRTPPTPAAGTDVGKAPTVATGAAESTDSRGARAATDLQTAAKAVPPLRHASAVAPLDRTSSNDVSPPDRDEPIFPQRHTGTILEAGTVRADRRSPAALPSDRFVIDAILADLEVVDPDRIPEFIEAVRQSAGSENFNQLLRTWQATVRYQARMASRPGQGTPQGTPAPARRAPGSDGPPIAPAARSAKNAGVAANSDVQPALLQQDDAGPLLIPQALGSAPRTGPEKPTPASTRITYRAGDANGAIDQKAANAFSAPADSPSGDWRQTLRHVAEALEQQDARSSEEQARLQIQSRLLFLLAGEAQRAVKPLVGVPPQSRDYWRHQLWALAHAFDPASDETSRAGEMLTLLDEAAQALQQQAGFAISTPVFCTRVSSFGHYDEFASYDLAPGAPVVVYWEVRNFASVEQRDGFHTRMSASFEIFDPAGQSVHRSEHPFPDDICRRRRRDYFSAILFQLPKDLRAGRHVLKVTVRDLSADRISEKQRAFFVK